MARKKKVNSGEVTDLELVEQFKKGSIEAFEEWDHDFTEYETDSILDVLSLSV